MGPSSPLHHLLQGQDMEHKGNKAAGGLKLIKPISYSSVLQLLPGQATEHKGTLEKCFYKIITIFIPSAPSVTGTGYGYGAPR